ncbi:HD-GYP domain-containing protein [Neobacillus sp. YIM B06451]|uniref:HD-GYP domain-containing protein n=1 Tax=Neobacillus sp. YIM B06451 TaxID=3070994 RepID=UPI00292ED193|nr:HD-GYP domain-containing protein [Neobacillus sp. YIM B06451]
MKKIVTLLPFLAIIFPYVVFELIHLGIFMNPALVHPHGHFYIVSIVSILASGIAILVGIAGSRLRNIKVSILSLAFISLSIMFSVHGLSTPSFIFGITSLPGVAAQLSMLLVTVWLWLSSFSSNNKFIVFLASQQKILVPSWTIALSIFCTIGLLNPGIVDIVPLNMNPLKNIITILVLLLNGLTIHRYFQSYRFTRFPLQLAIVYSSGWIMVSQIIMVRGLLWSLSWWIYHFLLLGSMVVMIIGLYKQYAVKGTVTESLRSLFITDPFERVTNSMPSSIRALVAATEEKDSYTAGHTFRVTLYALKLAEEMGLKPEELRIILQGSLLHDVGKIRIPDHILNKPGRLTKEERLLIEEHPITGFNMCKGLGFLKEELSIIRSHHEKWDGTGYPDRLSGESIPLYARIVAVADVYDALTSERSYRKAWTHGQAMEFLKENIGTHFDPVCVAAWEAVCIKDPFVYQYPSEFIKDGKIVKRALA